MECPPISLGRARETAISGKIRQVSVQRVRCLWKPGVRVQEGKEWLVSNLLEFLLPDDNSSTAAAESQ
jgi:hypothetical protein